MTTWDRDGSGPQAPVLVVGGLFSVAGDVLADNIATWDGVSWSSLGNGVDSRVRALATLPNGDIVAGGRFTAAGGVNANAIARWDGSSWAPLGSGIIGTVYAMTILPNGELVAGGDFTTAGCVSANHIARWDGSSWSPLGSGIIGTVYAMTILPNGDLVAGGDFTTAGGVSANRIARWDGASWYALGGGMGGRVNTLTVLPNGNLLAGGEFTTAGGASANHIARWDGSSWASLGSGVESAPLDPGPSVIALTALPNGDLVAGGEFTTAGGVSADNIARWDGSAWHPLGGGINDEVHAVTVLPSGDLVAGGWFPNPGGFGANYIARWDGSSWAPLGGVSSEVAFPGVEALTVLPNGDLVAGGWFSSPGDMSANCIARWDGSSWHPLGSGIEHPGGGVGALMLLPSGDLVAGGFFFSAGGVSAKHIARWDGSSWYSLGSGMSSWVEALTVLPSGDLVAGGFFFSAGGVSAKHIARWDGSSWYPLGGGMASEDYFTGVEALTVLPNGDLVAGGWFTTAGGVSANHIARWDGSSWAPLGSGMGGAPYAWAAVLALTVLPNGNLVAGGTFTTAGGVSANRIARWDGSSWAPLGSGIGGAPDYTLVVRTLTVLPNGDLVAGGRFSTAGGVNVENIARWDGSSWYPLGGGMNRGVKVLTVVPNGDLIAGGKFTTAGGRVSGYWARWGHPYHDLDGQGDVDLDDFTLVEQCLSGPGTAYSAGCACADSDEDGDIDMADLADFQNRFAGASLPNSPRASVNATHWRNQAKPAVPAQRSLRHARGSGK